MSEHTVINDQAFDIIPKNSTFFLIWRIEGTEYNGIADSMMENKPVQGDVYIHIHYWIGSKSSQDEAGVAAIKAMEMDDYLGGSPIQHREEEGQESQRFLSYFRKGIRVRNGGIASGFRKVDFTIKPALFHVKGKRNPIVRELPEISWLPFNDGDIFILATGKFIFLWTGKHANHMEKIKAIRVAQDIRAEHSHYMETIVIIDDGEEVLGLSIDELKAFEEFLPLDKKCVDKYDPKEDENKYEVTERAEVVLYKCMENKGELSINKVKNGPLVRTDLDSNDSFIIDNDVDGIWVWVGKAASRSERSGAMKYAKKLIEMNKYNPKTRIRKVIESAEVIEFKSLFKSWSTVVKQTPNFVKPLNTRVAKVMTVKAENKTIDSKTVKEDHRLSAETQLVDDGNGCKQCYYVEDSQLIPLKDEHLGTFYKHNCYVIVYTYNSDKVIIYYWFGSQSTPEERHFTETKVSELNDSKYENKGVLVRVIECEEPIHLLLMFHGLMIILKGRYDPNKSLDSVLLQVKGTTEYNTKSVEVDRNASALNSNCVFILSLPNKSFIWSGKRSIGDKREMAHKVVPKVTDKECQVVSEGEEPNDFWEGLGGKGSYESTQNEKLIQDFLTGRLWEWRKCTFEEISQYSQTDLDDEDIIILDAFDVLFLWFGNKLNDKYNLKEKAEIAEHFIRKDVKNRTTDLPIHMITQGSEPTNFTGFFTQWSPHYWDKTQSFEQLKAELRKTFMKKFPVN